MLTLSKVGTFLGVPDLGLRNGSKVKLDRAQKDLVEAKEWSERALQTCAIQCQIKLINAETKAAQRVMKAAANAQVAGIQKASMQQIRSARKEGRQIGQHRFTEKFAEINRRLEAAR